MNRDFSPTLPIEPSHAEPVREGFKQSCNGLFEAPIGVPRRKTAYRVAEVVKAPGRQDLQLRHHSQAHAHPLSALQSLSRHSLSPHARRVLVLRDDDPKARRPVWVLELHPPQYVGRGQPVLEHMAAAQAVVLEAL